MLSRNRLVYLFPIILFFAVSFPLSVGAQSNLKIGQACEAITILTSGQTLGNNEQCVTNSCEKSDTENSDGSDRWFCTCDTGADCAAQYGGNPDDWSCSSGASATHDLSYCIREENQFSNKSDNIKTPIGLANPSLIDALLDPGAATAATISEIEQITRAPQLRINIPGLTFTDPSTLSPVDEAGGSVLYIPFLGEYIAAVYRYAVAAAGVVAVIIIIVAGLRWTLSAGSSEAIGGAKKQIIGGVTGLILAVGSYTLLYTLNPELVSFRSLRLITVPTQPLPDFFEHAGDFDPVSGPAVATQTVCRGIEDCRTWCANNADPSTWPSHTQGMLDPAQTQRGLTAPGVSASSNKIIPIPMIEGLRQVGQAAQNHPEGPFTIQITSAYRPLRRQIELVCNKYNVGRESDIGRSVAWPGASKHGVGTAIDIRLIRDRDKRVMLTGFGSGGLDKQLEEKWEEGTRITGEIFYSVPGWQRLTKENWHYEYNESRKDCRTMSCLVATKSCTCPGSN